MLVIKQKILRDFIIPLYFKNKKTVFNYMNTALFFGFIFFTLRRFMNVQKFTKHRDYTTFILRKNQPLRMLLQNSDLPHFSQRSHGPHTQISADIDLHRSDNTLTA